MIVRKLDLDNIYSLGHDAVALPRGHYQALMGALDALEWQSDPDDVYARIPGFLADSARLKRSDKSQQERDMHQLAMDACPSAVLMAAQALLSDREVMGEWVIAHQPELRFISIWDGAEDLDWHWDGPAGADFFFLMYLNREPGWPIGEGGQLMVGKRSLDGNYMQVDTDAVQHLATFDPCTRTLICCNNQNPQFVHKVVPLHSGQERIVFMIGFDMRRFAPNS
jgi:hypothetical protein